MANEQCRQAWQGDEAGLCRWPARLGAKKSQCPLGRHLYLEAKQTDSAKTDVELMSAERLETPRLQVFP
jgi:hypothetical protein